MGSRVLASLFLMILFSTSVNANEDNLCSYSKTSFVNFVGGTAAGTALTSAIAGDSIVMIITSNAVLVGTAPAIAPTIALGATTAAAAYGTLKAWCAREETGELVSTWYQTSVDATSDSMEVTLDAQGRAVSYTTRVYEEVRKKRIGISNRLTDYLCTVTGDC